VKTVSDKVVRHSFA